MGVVESCSSTDTVGTRNVGEGGVVVTGLSLWQGRLGVRDRYLGTGLGDGVGM